MSDNLTWQASGSVLHHHHQEWTFEYFPSSPWRHLRQGQKQADMQAVSLWEQEKLTMEQLTRGR